MRKILAAVLILMLATAVLSACRDIEKKDIVKESISDLSMDILEGKNEDFTVSISVGKREGAQKLDGIKNELVDFFVIKVQPVAMKDLAGVEYTLKSGSMTYNGILERALSGRGYSFDLKKHLIYENGKIMVDITYGDKKGQIEVTSIFTGNQLLKYEKVLELVKTKCADKIAALTEGDKFKGEIVMRVIGDKSNNASKYYWYVAIVDGEKNIDSMLIDAKSGQFVA